AFSRSTVSNSRGSTRRGLEKPFSPLSRAASTSDWRLAPTAPLQPTRRALRCASLQATGAADYWYAKNPDIKTLSDTNGHTIAFSTNGFSTHSVVRAFTDKFKPPAKPQATGNPSAALTAVMTDQVDVGWASPPFGRKEIEEGKIHLVARATDATLVRDQ